MIRLAVKRVIFFSDIPSRSLCGHRLPGGRGRFFRCSGGSGQRGRCTGSPAAAAFLRLHGPGYFPGAGQGRFADRLAVFLPRRSGHQLQPGGQPTHHPGRRPGLPGCRNIPVPRRRPVFHHPADRPRAIGLFHHVLDPHCEIRRSRLSGSLSRVTGSETVSA
jgi:hypothetical protein